MNCFLRCYPNNNKLLIYQAKFTSYKKREQLLKRLVNKILSVFAFVKSYQNNFQQFKKSEPKYMLDKSLSNIFSKYCNLL